MKLFNLKSAFQVFLLLFLLIVFSNCKKEVKTNWEIKVLSAGSAVSGAAVSIYNTEEGWRYERDAIKSGTTDSEGKVMFEDIGAFKYYADVRKNNMSNWEGAVVVSVEDGKINKTDIEIRDNLSFKISNKIWKIIRIDSSSIDISSRYTCYLDNTYNFSKGNKTGHFSFYQGQSVCDSANIYDYSYIGTWSCTSSTLKIVDNIGGSSTTVADYNILGTLSNDTLALENQSGLNVKWIMIKD